jgi:hypothetical protein
MPASQPIVAELGSRNEVKAGCWLEVVDLKPGPPYKGGLPRDGAARNNVFIHITLELACVVVLFALISLCGVASAKACDAYTAIDSEQARSYVYAQPSRGHLGGSPVRLPNPEMQRHARVA